MRVIRKKKRETLYELLELRKVKVNETFYKKDKTILALAQEYEPIPCIITAEEF